MTSNTRPCLGDSKDAEFLLDGRGCHELAGCSNEEQPGNADLKEALQVNAVEFFPPVSLSNLSFGNGDSCGKSTVGGLKRQRKSYPVRKANN